MRLPESWREVSLPNIAELIGGGTPERSNTNYFDGTIPWITPSDITNSDSIWVHTTQEYLTEEGLRNSPAKLLPIGSILMATRVAVGRAAIAGVELATNQDFTSLVIDPNVVDSEYLARTIESLSGLLESRSQGSTIKGIPRATVERLKIPLPTLPEQQRIVDVLRQAEAFEKSRAATEETLQTLSREYYYTLFGDVLRNDKEWTVRKIGQVSDVVRGSSPRPQGDPRLYGGPVPRLMVSDLTRDGLWVDATTDSLTLEGAKSSRPMPAQSVIVTVSGAPGLTAILTHDACIHDGFVGLRDLHSELLPEFVAFTLNLFRAKHDQQAVGAVFRNLTTDQVKAIIIPVPPIDLQKKFRVFLLQLRSVMKDIEKSKQLLSELSGVLAVDAFSGDLTANWRKHNQEEITAAAIARDALLRERGAKLRKPITESKPIQVQNIDSERPARHWLLGELSEFQRQVLAVFKAYYEQNDQQPLLAEDQDVFTRFCDDEEVVERLQIFGSSLTNRIRRTLSQLAALGLIAKVTLPKQNLETKEREYLKAFRPLRSDEYTRLNDVAQLRKVLSANETMHHFTVMLDYETSEHAGAGGMFQVASLDDENSKDRTDLVDQGKHYNTINELTEDIAHRLGVSASQVELEEV